ELVYLADGRSLLSGDAAGRVFLWELAAGRSELLFVATARPWERAVRSLHVSRDGRWISAWNFNGFILWDRTIQASRPWPKEPITRLPVVLSPDGQFLLTGGVDGRLWLWDLGAQATPREWSPGPARVLTISPDGRLAASATIEIDYGLRRCMYYILVREFPSGRAINTLNDLTETETLAFSADGSLLASGGSTSVRLWDTKSWQRRSKVTHGKAQGLVHVRCLAFHPSASLLATAGDAPFVTFWDTATGRERARFDWGIGRILSLAF